MLEGVRGAGDKPAADDRGRDIICRVGSPMDVSDLLRVGAHRAAAILVMMSEKDQVEEDESDGTIQNGATLRTPRAAVRHLHEPVRHTWRARDAAPGLEDRAADVAPERLRGRGELHARRRAPGGFPGGPVQVLQLAHVRCAASAVEDGARSCWTFWTSRASPSASPLKNVLRAHVQHVGRVRRTDLRLRDAQAVHRGGVHRHLRPGMEEEAAAHAHGFAPVART